MPQQPMPICANRVLLKRLAILSVAFICAGDACARAQQGPGTSEATRFAWREARQAFQQAGKLIGQERFSEAEDVLQSAGRDLPAPYSDRAKTHIRSLTSAVNQIDPSVYNGYYGYGLLGRLCLELNAYEAAVTWIRRTQAAHADDFGGYTRPLAWCLGEAGKIEESLAAYDALLKRYPANDWQRALNQQKEFVQLRAAKSKDVAFIAEMVQERYMGGHSVAHQYLAALEVLNQAMPAANNHRELEQLYGLVFTCLTKLGDHAARRAWEDHLIQTTGSDEIAARIMADRAGRAFRNEQLEEALEMYRLIRDRYSMTKLVGLAQYNVAYVLKQQKKFDEAIAEYRQLIDSDVNDRDPGSHIMEAYRNYRHRAALDIASCHEAQGNFPEALRYLELARDKHRYQTWCVTCAGQSRESLAERIEACWMQLGRHTEVAESRLADLKGSGLRPSRATSLIQLYRDASQLDDLTQMLDEIDEATLKDWKAKGYFKDQTPEQMRRQLPTWTARELLRIAELGERGDTAALIAIAEDISHYESDLSQPYTSNWRPRAAAEALARLGQRGFAAIKERYSSEQGGSAWLIYAVGHCNTPEAFQWLRTHGWKQTNWQTACHFTYALSLKGAAGRAVLEQMADEDDANLGRAAEKWLQHKPGPAGKPPAPRLVPGSLPRQSSAGTSNG